MTAPKPRRRSVRFAIVAVVCLLLGAATTAEMAYIAYGIATPKARHDFQTWSPGFALDAALYASAWYLLLFTPLPLYRAGRRRFRVSRGMCPACAYDLKGSPSGPCPECGHIPGATA